MVDIDLVSDDVRSRADAIRLVLLDVDGVMTNGHIHMTDQGEGKTFYSLDGLGIRALQKSGIEVGIISGRGASVVSNRAAELDIHIVEQHCRDKRGAAEALLPSRGLSLEQVAFVGDDLIDLSLLKVVGLACAVPNGVSDVRAVAHYVTQASGGLGAVREVAELVLKSQGRWAAFLARFQ